MTDEVKQPGADLSITRRDMIAGAVLIAGASTIGGLQTAVGATPPMAKALTQDAPGYYPPGLTGMRGSHPGAFEAAHAIRDGKILDQSDDTGEHYDLVVVGAGLSGLAAAYYMRKKMPKARILILDNHDDFGGHARRNETKVDGRTVLNYGGTMYIVSPSAYTVEGRALLAEIGVDKARFLSTAGKGQRYDMFGLSPEMSSAILFDKATFGADRLVTGKPTRWRTGATPAVAEWKAFLAQAPLSEAVKASFLKLNTEPADYLAGMTPEAKISLLRSISYTDYLLKYAKVDPGVIAVINKESHGGINGVAGLDTLSAWVAYESDMAGFDALGLDRPPPRRWMNDAEGEDIHFPDGNHTVAKLLVRWLIPAALPGNTMEDSILTHVDYNALDKPTNDVRLRLGSTVGRVRHLGTPEKSAGVEITYVRGGKPVHVKADAVVLACYNAMIPYICPEIPEPQKEALRNAVRMPLVYGTVVVRNWEAIAKLGVGDISCPGDTYWWDNVVVDWPSAIGGYKPAISPSEPMPLHFTKVPTQPGLPPKDQFRAGRAQLLATDLPTIEEATRALLQNAFGSAGFDAKRDIVSITVNRHPHGYAGCANSLYDPDWAPEEQPWVIGRKRLGRIAIANSDAGAICLTQAAFDQAHRAVTEIVADVIQPLQEFPWGIRN